MGTNYYLRCPSCGIEKHLGKRSGLGAGQGYEFALGVPEQAIRQLDALSIIQDEYGKALTTEEFQGVVSGAACLRVDTIGVEFS